MLCATPRCFQLRTLTGDSDWGHWLGTLLRTRPEELKFKLWSTLSEKCQTNLRRTVVCGCGLRLRTRPKELKFQLWSRLSEKCQKKLRSTVVCDCGLRPRTPLWTRPEELSTLVKIEWEMQKKIKKGSGLWCGVVFSDYNTYPSPNFGLSLG